MSDQPQASGENQPQLAVIVQYLKDLSFESPNAPKTLVPAEARPEIEIGVDVQAKQMGENEFEVTLAINATAKRGEDAMFVVECTYAGLFALRNIPREMLEAVVLVECPRLIFPYARAIISNATRDGGFPPLNLDPVDFVALYQRNRAQGAPSNA
ncbi:MAG: protein-export chaperone SecB [Alphaproteobacteria bacterium]|nr:protein-export chaperone SecB [Alphaproteobacteria bacterium]